MAALRHVKEEIMNRERLTALILVLALSAAANLTCKKDTAGIKGKGGKPAASETDIKKILSSFKTETIDTRRIRTANYIGTPADDTVAKFTPNGEIGRYKKYSVTVYASPMNKAGRIPDRVYVWTPVLAGTKSGHSSSFFVIDKAKTLKGERYGYAYITGDILLDEKREIVFATVFDGRVTAVDYYNPDGSKANRRASLRDAL